MIFINFNNLQLTAKCKKKIIKRERSNEREKKLAPLQNMSDSRRSRSR